MTLITLTNLTQEISTKRKATTDWNNPKKPLNLNSLKHSNNPNGTNSPTNPNSKEYRSKSDNRLEGAYPGETMTTRYELMNIKVKCKQTVVLSDKNSLKRNISIIYYYLLVERYLDPSSKSPHQRWLLTANINRITKRQRERGRE
jgi:hypothetical protein